MAEREKGKSNFDLQKPRHRQFDLEKKPKRQFDLAKDDDTDAQAVGVPGETQEAAAQQQFDATADHQQQLSRGRSTVNAAIWLAVIVAAALIIWWLWPSSPSQALPDEPVIEQAAADSEGAEMIPADADTQTDAQVAEEVAEEVPQETAPQAQPEVATPQPQQAPAPAQQPAAQAPKALAATSTPATTSRRPTADTETEAQNVIRGDYGNNPDRRTALGDRYHEIQSRVNQLMAQD